MSEFDDTFATLCGLLSGRADASVLNRMDTVEWRAFSHLINYHRVAQYCAHEILNNKAIQPPKQMVAKLQQALSDASKRRFRQLFALHQIESGFRHADIPFLLQKSEALTQRYYVDPLQRHSNDIDILVSPDLFEKAVECLNALGFQQTRPAFEVSPAMMTTLMHKTSGMDFYREADGLQVELHWRLLQNPNLLPWSHSEILRNCETLEIGETKLTVMKSSSQLIYMCCHGAKHGWFRLKWLLDIRLMVERMSEDEISEARSLARITGLESILDAAVDLCGLYLGNSSSTFSVDNSNKNSRLTAYPRSRIEQALREEETVVPGIRDKARYIYYYMSLRREILYRCSIIAQYSYNLEDISRLKMSSNWLFLYAAAASARRLFALLGSGKK